MDAIELTPVLPIDRTAPPGLPPLAVDLDGTLVKTDLLVESVLALLKKSPLCVFQLPFWLLNGRAYLKAQIAKRVSLDVEFLPDRTELLDYLKLQRDQDRTIVLATSADRSRGRWRIISGCLILWFQATAQPIYPVNASHWLLALSTFLFFSMALMNATAN